MREHGDSLPTLAVSAPSLLHRGHPWSFVHPALVHDLVFCYLPSLRFSFGPGGLLTQTRVSYLLAHVPLEKQQRKSSRTAAIQKGVDNITAVRGVQWFTLKPLRAVIMAKTPHPGSRVSSLVTTQEHPPVYYLLAQTVPERSSLSCILQGPVICVGGGFLSG